MYLDGHLTYNKVIDTNSFKNRLFGRECWANGLIIWRKRHPDPHLTSRSKVDCGRIQGSLCPFGLCLDFVVVHRNGRPVRKWVARSTPQSRLGPNCTLGAGGPHPPTPGLHTTRPGRLDLTWRGFRNEPL